MESTSKRWNKLAKAAQYHAQRDGERNCCSVFAIAAVTGVSFGKAQRVIRDCGRVTGSGATAAAVMRATEAFGYTVTAHYPDTQTVARFAANNPTGKFMCVTSGHICAVIDGEVVDWQGGERKRIVAVLAVS